MILYVVYKNKKIAIDQQLPQHKGDIINVVSDDKLSATGTTTVTTAEVQIICTSKNKETVEELDHDQIQHGVVEEKNRNHHRNGKSMEDCYSIIEVQPAATVKCEA